MKRLQISLEPELDEQLGLHARRAGVSKAEVVRRSLKDKLKPSVPLAEDPLFQLRFASGRGRRPGETIDDLIYGPKRDR